MSKSTGKTYLKSIIIFATKLAVAGGLLYYLLQKIEFAEILTVVSSANLFYLAAAFIVALLHRYLTACQTKIVLGHQGINLSAFRVFIINLEAYFYDLFIPGGIGSITAKWHKFSKPEGKRAQAFTSIVVVRLLNIITMLLIGAIAILLKNPFNSSYINAIILGILMVLACIMLAIFNKRAAAIVEKYITNNLLSFAPNSIKEKIVKVQASFNNFQELSDYNLFLILSFSICAYIVATITFFLVSISVHINLSIVIIAWITSVITLIQMIPISFFGLGVREGAFLFLLSKYHIPGSGALAFSLLILAIATIIALLGGAIEAKNLFSKHQLNLT